MEPVWSNIKKQASSQIEYLIWKNPKWKKIIDQVIYFPI